MYSYRLPLQLLIRIDKQVNGEARLLAMSGLSTSIRVKYDLYPLSKLAALLNPHLQCR